MTETDFLHLLNDIRFAERYWSLCEAFDSATLERSMTKAEIKSAFAATGLRTKFADRIAIVTLGDAVGLHWEAKAVPKRTGYFELSIYGAGPNGGIGSNFQSLAYRSRQLANPTFTRTPPYPAPDPGGNSDALNAIVTEFAHILGDVFSRLTALRRAADPQ